ncbi:MAG: DUF5330 domain-containing protein [Anderseniella sp.]|nr:DUF5330 domain-containing protein [Anderseniella sp.]
MGITRIFIVGMAALILAPMPPDDTTLATNPPPAAELQTHQLVSVAIGTFTDVSSFCERQPLTCTAMSDVVSVAQTKAKYSVRLAYEWAIGTDMPGDAAHSAAEDTLPVSGTDHEVNEMPQPDAAGGKGISDLLNSSSVDALVTGSTTILAAADTGTNTLRIEDILPNWRGPEPSRQG